MRTSFREIRQILKDGRFISILKILLKYEKQHSNGLLSAYLVRLVSGFSLSSSKKYLSRLDKFWDKSNPFQKTFKE